MNRLGNPLISISAPLLILLAITGFLHREGKDKIQAIPALVVGSGLILTGGVRRFLCFSRYATKRGQNFHKVLAKTAIMMMFLAVLESSRERMHT